MVENYPGFIGLKVDKAMKLINLSEIVYVRTCDNYLRIFLANQRPLLVRMTITKLRTLLPPEEFVQIHRCSIVSASRIHFKGGKKVRLDGNVLPISSSRLSSFRAFWKERKTMNNAITG